MKQAIKIEFFKNLNKSPSAGKRQSSNMENSGTLAQLDSSTIDGNVEFVHSQYSCILTSQVSIQFLCPNSDNF